MFWINLAALAVTSVLDRLLQPHAKRTNVPELEIPKAEEGTPLPIVYGVAAVPIIVTWWGDLPHRFGETRNHGTFYNANLTADLCHGPIDQVLDVQVGGKSLRLHQVVKADSTGNDATATLSPDLNPDGYTFTSASSVEIQVQARQLFGGQDREGGVEGKITIHRGSLDDIVDPMVANAWAKSDLPSEGSAYPGVCHATFGTVDGLTFYWGTVAQPKTVVFLLRHVPRALLQLDLDPEYTSSSLTEAQQIAAASVGLDANGAEIIYDRLVHGLRGAGVSPTLCDLDSFVVEAKRFRSEGLGLSAHFDEQQDVINQIDDILDHLDAILFTHTETGLITLRALRGGYAIEDLPVVSRSTAADLEVTRPSWRETTNDVKVTFRQFDATPLNGATTTETITPPGGMVFFSTGLGTGALYGAILSVNGRDISNVTVRNITKSTTLTQGFPADGGVYVYNASTGRFTFYKSDGVLDAGDVIEVDYTNGSEAVGYRDATAIAQDLANQMATNEVRAETYSRPFYTTPINAGKAAQRLLKQRSRPLAKATWTEDRTGHARQPGDVVALTWEPFGFSLTPFRVAKVTVRQDGRIAVNAVEDVFGADVMPYLADVAGGTGGATQTCPRISIGCGLGGSNVRIAFFPSDTNFTIRLWQADDADGTNRVLVDDYVGTTAYYDTATTGKFYQAQLVRTNWVDGPLTPYITCTPSGGSPSAPTCTLPVVAVVPDVAAGTLTLSIADDENRVSSVQFRHRTGNGEFSDWATATESGGVYTDTVTLDTVYTSRIEWEVTYLDCSGNEDAVFEGGQDYVPGAADPEPDPYPGLTETPVELVLLGATLPCRFSAVPAARTPLDDVEDDGVPQTKFPLGQFTAARVVGVVTETSLPDGAYLSVDFENPLVDDDWHPLDEDVGPSLAIDPTSVGSASGKARDGEWVTIRDEARDNVRLRAVIAGGDDDTAKTVCVSRVVLQLLAQDLSSAPAAETTYPAVYDPGSCDTPGDLDDFGYADQTAAFAAWPED